MKSQPKRPSKASIAALRAEVRILKRDNERLQRESAIEGAELFVSTNFEKFHRWHCHWVIDRESRWQGSHEAAVARGMKPCGSCRA
jgi:hypothetical protein